MNEHTAIKIKAHLNTVKTELLIVLLTDKQLEEIEIHLEKLTKLVKGKYKK